MPRFFYRRVLGLVLVSTAAALATAAHADTDLRGYPSHWRFQDYEDGAINLWYTPATGCQDGHLFLPASTTAEVRQRLWSLLLTASATVQQVGIAYNSSCNVVNFYSIEH